MKKVLLMLAISAGCLLSAHAQVRFGIHANGIGASGIMKDPEVDLKQKIRFSFKAGVSAEITLGESISLIPQLNYVNKGGKLKEKQVFELEGIEYEVSVNGRFKLNYLELPVNVVYHTGNLSIGAGPSLSYGLSGKSKFTVGEDDEVEMGSGKVVFDGDEDANDLDMHLKALELGANFYAAWKFNNGIFIQANYNLGLSNISPIEDSKYKNNYFGLGVGYYFNRK